MDTYLCSYTFRGDRWGFDIQAESFQDAQWRLHAIMKDGMVDGKLIASIPVTPTFSVWDKFSQLAKRLLKLSHG